MIEPMLLILAPPVAVFGWVAYDLRRHSRPRAEQTAEPEPAAVRTTIEFAPAAPAWATREAA